MTDKIKWTGKPSLMLAFPKILILLLVSVGMIFCNIYLKELATFLYFPYMVFLGGVFGLFVVHILQLKVTTYTLEEDRLLVQSGILRRVTDELELFRVRDFQLNEPILLRFFGLGNLTLISSDRTSPTTHLLGISEITSVHNRMRLLVRECCKSRGVKDLEVS